MIRIRNFAKLQHFKDRRPPWIKLYREILDDMEWHALSGDDAKLLISLWLLASEDKTKNGVLPCNKTIAFRLRLSEAKVKQSLTKLSHWVLHDDISAISDGYHDGPPERETETETETEDFDGWYAKYPRKEARGRAEKAWARLTDDQRVKAVDGLALWSAPDDPKFIPLPATWLNDKRWADNPRTNGFDSDPEPYL
jgi:hypothetical protein